MEVLALGVLPVLGAMLLTVVLLRVRPAWSRWRTMLVAAALLPGAGLALCITLFADAALSPADRCGVDACAMAMAGSMVLGSACVIVFGASLIACAGVTYAMRRR